MAQPELLRALIVDECADSRNLARILLRVLGVDADLAESGEAALGMMAATTYPLVFVDCDLSGESGVETTRLLRERERATCRQGSTIIGVAAMPDPGAARRMMAAGATTIVTKPLRLAAIRQCLPGWLAQPMPRPPKEPRT